MTRDSRNKKVLVTGASGVLGRHVSERLTEQGYTVLGLDREASVLSEELKVVACDVTNQQAVRSVVEDFAGEGESLYGLVNCAAIIPTSGLWELEAEGFLKTLEINSWGTFNMSREAGRVMMRSGGGRIVNVASVAGFIGGLVGGPDYAASKAAVMVLTKVLAKELAAHGVTINTVAPGALESPATDALTGPQVDTLLQKIPAGRLGRMEEVVHSIEYLLSDRAGYVNGSTLDVNGGVYLR